ncbi:MAG: rod shape-determining protein RodA [Clostridia bacterium]|nr:rod shape-determining protein RodA [Deltaproteobacteria bacterium]
MATRSVRRSGGFRLSLMNWPLICVILVVSLLGVYNLHSAAAAESPGLYLQQLKFLGLGAFLATLLLIPDYRVSESVAYAVYGVFCLLLVGVIMHGHHAKGAQRWLMLGPFQFQPSEFAKLAIVFGMSRYLSTRVHPDGYTLLSLARPLNPSRPLAVLGAIALFWNKPVLVDPMGEAARLIHSRLGSAEVETAELMWFRVVLVIGLLLLSTSSALMIIRIERSQALLNPWPAKRRRRLLGFVTLVTVALACWLAMVWEAPLVRDPVASIVNRLNAKAAVGGPYAEVAAVWWLRGLFVAFGCGYLLWSVLALRRRTSGSFIDILIAPLDIMAVPAALVAMQPDLDNAIVIFLTGLTMVFVVGVRWRTIALLGILGTMFAGVSWFGVLKDYQKRRILTFIDPENDVQGAGWNAVQSMIAVGSGRWVGKGHMEGTQTQLSFLPEQHTDFAFSVWAEEQGFLGCAILLALYTGFLVLIFSVASDAREPYGALLAAGLGAGLFWEAIVNVGMVIGMLPVVGLTLPFFSYGGSSLIAKLAAVGIVLNVHLRRRVS